VKYQDRITYLRFVAVFASLGFAASLLVITPSPSAAESTPIASSVRTVLSGTSFDPGYIISDGNFYDRYAMTELDIQNFLDSKIGTCNNSNCLNVARTTSFNRPADAICGAYSGVANELTSSIIFKVQTACGVSAKVVLVTLQKEQGLLSNNEPSSSRLSRAMGYGCPDSASGACDSEYGGLYNQIYWAARQFVRYSNPPGTSTYFTWYPVGSPVSILYHPDAGRCGAGAVTIRNKATAALYYYTPYQPNSAALSSDNLRSTGDSCSSYGNRNFWVYYNDWFGDPTTPAGSAFGAITSSVGQAGGIAFSGWAVFPNALTVPVHLAVNIGNRWIPFEADQSNPAAQAVFPGAGLNHGFSGVIPASPGQQSFCLWASGVTAATVLECRTVTVPVSPPPQGRISDVVGVPGGFMVTGWAVQPSSITTPVHMAVNLGSRWISVEADQPNPAGETAFPGAGQNHGFSAMITAPAGVQAFCLWAAGPAGAAIFECRTVTVPVSPPPQGRISDVVGVPGGFMVTGWAVQPSSITTPVHMAVNLGSRWISVEADQPNPAGETAFPGAGQNHGFSAMITAPAGVQAFCLWAAGPAGAAIFECRTVTVP